MPIAVGQRAEKLGDLVRGDIVRGGGGELVITGEQRQGQRFLWIGVKVRGHSGTEYKLSRGIVKIGHDSNHPALLLVQGKRSPGGLDPSQKVVIGQMCDAVDGGDLPRARALATAVRAMLTA